MTRPLHLRRSQIASLEGAAVRFALLAGLAFLAASAFAQRPKPAGLPAMPPTSLPAVNPLPPPIAATPNTTAAAPADLPHRATVTYANGLLDVRADDSSLNQILREISRLTGMTVTGGVADERVFGNYGPSEPATILATLLDGTGSNMLLRETSTDGPAELILTPRNGGPTPPSPDSPSYDSYDNPRTAASYPDGGRRGAMREGTPPPRGFHGEAQQPLPASNGAPAAAGNGGASDEPPTAPGLPAFHSVSTQSLPEPSTAPANTGIVSSPNPPPAASTTGNTTGSTTGAAASSTPPTAEQIFQQLQQLQQKNHPAGATSSTAAASSAPASAPAPATPH